MQNDMKAKENRDQFIVRNLVFAQYNKQDIADAIGLSVSELEAKYGEILKTEHQRVSANIVNAFIQNALKGNVAAQIFFMKAVCGFSEPNQDKIGNYHYPLAEVPRKEESVENWRHRNLNVV